MFKSKNNVKNVQNGVLPQNPVKESGTTCVISAGTIIEGKFSASEDVRLDGAIIGEVRCEKRIVMGESGRIDGTVNSYDLVVRGTIKGDVNIKNLLHLQNTSYVEGTITAQNIIVDEGASYSGECRVGKKPAPAPQKAKLAVKGI